MSSAAANLTSSGAAGFRITSPGIFRRIGVPLIAGRDFNERDLYECELVAIVIATLVRHLFQEQSPLGRRIKCGPASTETYGCEWWA